MQSGGPSLPAVGLHAALALLLRRIAAVSVRMDVLGYLLSLAAFALCFIIGWFFLSYSLYTHLDDKDYSIQALWSLVFGLSCNLLVLVLLEILPVVSEGVRLLNWFVTVQSLLFLLLVYLPFYHIDLGLNENKPGIPAGLVLNSRLAKPKLIERRLVGGDGLEPPTFSV